MNENMVMRFKSEWKTYGIEYAVEQVIEEFQDRIRRLEEEVGTLRHELKGSE